MTNMDLSEKIVKLRKNNNLTQEQLAEQLNVSRQSVSKWESGQAAPDIDKIVAMGEIFHVTTDYLLKPSELDELAMKTEMLEKRRKEEGKAILHLRLCQYLHYRFCGIYAYQAGVLDQ